mmetsp:Transcript_51742/g.123148  ORF Transcript_51742/g.123148 Transcript_51742/m.123148 type:complete len:384 (+) Transcript_51742:43-1194(+)
MRRSQRLQDRRAAGVRAENDNHLEEQASSSSTAAPGAQGYPGSVAGGGSLRKSSETGEKTQDRVTVLPLSVIDPEAAMWYHSFTERWYAERAPIVRDCYFRLRRKTSRDEVFAARLLQTRQEIAQRHDEVQVKLRQEVDKAQEQLQEKRAAIERDKHQRLATESALKKLRKEHERETKSLEARKAELLVQLDASKAVEAPPQLKRGKLAMRGSAAGSMAPPPSSGAAEASAQATSRRDARGKAAASRGVRKPVAAKARISAAPRARVGFSPKAGTIARQLAARARQARVVPKPAEWSVVQSRRQAAPKAVPEPPEFVGEAVGKVGKGLKPLKVKSKGPPSGSFSIIEGVDVGNIGVELPPHIEFIGEPVGKGMKVASNSPMHW